mgnify:CR=1 FL=1
MDQKRNRKTPSWCGSRKRKAARTPYDARITEYAHQGHLVPPRSILKTPEQIVGIRESGKINIAVLDHVAAHIKAGMTTADQGAWRRPRPARLPRVPQKHLHLHQ